MIEKTQEELCQIILDKLDDLKAQDPSQIDVSERSSITDNLIIVTGTSDRHVKSLADYLVQEMKKLGIESIGEEGYSVGDWIVVDFGSVMVHIMQTEARKTYALEKLWA